MSNSKTVVLSSMKDECPYILEFVAHYKVLGFDDILIVTNDNTDRTLELLERLSKAGIVHYIAHKTTPGDVPQRNAFRLANAWLREHADGAYVHVADADEFLMLYKDPDIRAYLARFPDALGISFNWKFYGSDGHVERPPGLVQASYSYRASDDLREHRTLKSMFLADERLLGFSAHFPHHVDLENIFYQYSDGTPYPAINSHSKPHQNWSKVTYELAAVNHYGIKSWSEFLTKRQRGRGAIRASSGKVRHTDEYFEKLDNKDVFDPLPPAFLARVEAEMQAIFCKAGLSDAFEPSYFGLQAKS